LLYPLLLALGYLVGFSGWSLAYWALAIGVICFIGSSWLVYRIGCYSPLLLSLTPDQKNPYAWVIALAFVLTGPFIWAALSGMETSLFVFSVLLAFYCIQRGWFRRGILASLLMVLIRPEGLILAGLGVLALALNSWPQGRKDRLRRTIELALPLAAGLIQPAINLLATGSASSSGMQAKSHLYNTSQPLADRLSKCLEFFGRMWLQLLTGESPDFGTFTVSLIGPSALAVLLIGVWWAWRRRRLNIAVVMLAWIIALSAAVATLDTAFWQFKRYQLPIMALFYPAAAWVIAPLSETMARSKWRLLQWAVPAVILIGTLFTTQSFAQNYVDNVRVVRDQQVPMARWIGENLPEDARIGVHDVGLVRYFGDRALYDVVGLTTPGPAPSWRQGPGAIYEHLSASEYRPDYFAIYPDVQGLRYLLNAGVFGEVLAEFPVKLPRYNVASATDYQAVYRADWSATRAQEQVAQAITLDYLDGMRLVDQIDVADLDSEADHAYRWWQDQSPPGFVTEVYRHVYQACGLTELDCWAVDGGRVITGGEEFDLHTRPGEDLILITRVHGRASVPLDIYINGERWEQRVQPEMPGRWLEIVTLIPAEYITSSHTRIRIEPQIDDPKTAAYLPYYHWAYQGKFATPEAVQAEPFATFGSAGQVKLLDAALTLEPGQVRVRLDWLGPAPQSGDGVVFIHLYNQSNLNTEPAAQVVLRPMRGVWPPGNWLPGVIHDEFIVPLPDDLPPGIYRVAVGMFEARTGDRYPVAGQDTDPDRRLFIGEVTVEEIGQ
ncbi:MAG: hypothetical protein HY866_17030, partial [Chloroflexi bacterium]|nr:hypothetical protein [Chloroflexota bacterium]